MYQDIANALRSERFAYSDLGDGTAVLTSLSDSRIISLNVLGNEIVQTLLSDDSRPFDDQIDELGKRIAQRYNIDDEQARADIESFAAGLSKQLGQST